MSAARLLNSIGKKRSTKSISKEWKVIFLLIGRLGIGLAIAGGVVNSMLYNGE